MLGSAVHRCAPFSLFKQLWRASQLRPATGEAGLRKWRTGGVTRKREFFARQILRPDERVKWLTDFLVDAVLSDEAVGLEWRRAVET